MATDLCDQIGQTRPFACLEEEAHLGIARTAAVLEHALAEALKPYDITPTQYNVLRILRGAGVDGLCRNHVRARMVASVPDASRLLDRLEAAGLIQRERSAIDRRYVTTRISTEGLRVLEELDAPVQALHQEHLGHLGEADLRTLIGLLDRIRAEL